MCKNMHCKATSDEERNQVRCEYANSYSQECAAINIVMKWRSKYLCRKYDNLQGGELILFLVASVIQIVVTSV